VVWASLLDFTNGNGLAARYRFLREGTPRDQPTLGSTVGLPSGACHLLIELHNTSALAFTHISVTKPQLGPEQSLHPFSPVSLLPPASHGEVRLSIELAGSKQPVRFHIATDRGVFGVEVKPPMGELLRPARLSLADFETTRTRLGGMHESVASLPVSEGNDAATAARELIPPILAQMNAAVLTSPPPTGALVDGATGSGGGGSQESGESCLVRLAAASLHDGKPVLVAVDQQSAGGSLRLAVHAEDAIYGNILLDELKAAVR